jgi:hypothetical protein
MSYRFADCLRPGSGCNATRCTNFSIFILGMKLYMFRTVSLPIIRRFSLYPQQWCMSYRFCDCLRAGSGWNATRCNNFWNFILGMKLHVSDSFSVHHQEFFTLHTAIVSVSKPVWHILLLCVQWKTPDDGQRNCPKHVELHSKNKIWEISASSWFYYKKFNTM